MTSGEAEARKACFCVIRDAANATRRIRTALSSFGIDYGDNGSCSGLTEQLAYVRHES